MRQKRVHFVFALLLAFTIVLAFTSCEKLSVNKLRANYYFSRANQLFTDGKFRRAMTEYENTLKYNPDMIQAYRFLGESYKSLYKIGVDTPENLEVADKALDAFKKAYEAEPDNKEIIFSLGDMYNKMKNFEDAEKLYLRILELEPGNMGNYYVVAEFYKTYAAENEELRSKAESMYMRRVELDPENPQGYAYLANYFENLAPSPEAYDHAAEYWDRRIALDPNNPEAWLAKGVNRWSRSYRFQNLPAAVRMRTAQEALQALQKANEIDPNYPEPYSWLSVLYQSVLIKLEPDKESRYKAEADRAMERWNDMRKRAAEKKKLEDELKKVG
ncbi:MAG: tetratricopeptide repeat protein [Candidatus Aminicenantes bacterium]|nr:tetratricopeptide repeat protein [Candidatus Aminicenantes bacterium]